MSPLVRLAVRFFQGSSGREPVREWLGSLSREEKRAIGADIKTVQYGWPLAMPLVRPLGGGLWEIRTVLGARMARVVFAMHEGQIVLLHGFLKKSRKIPARELRLVRQRHAQLRQGR